MWKRGVEFSSTSPTVGGFDGEWWDRCKRLSPTPRGLRLRVGGGGREGEEGGGVGWVTQLDGEGHLYYYHTVTHQAEWELPLGATLVTAKTAPLQQMSAVSSGTLEVGSSGGFYYHSLLRGQAICGGRSGE